MAYFLSESTDKFCYVHSCELDTPLQIKIGTLEGEREQKSIKALLSNPELKFSGLYQSGCSDLYVKCQVFSAGKPISLPVQTSYKSFTTRWNWNEWVTLPIQYKDLPRDAMLAMTVYDVYGPRKAIPVGGTVVSVFGKHGCVRRGIHDLKLWPGVVADGNIKTITPGKPDGKSITEMNRLTKLAKKHNKGRLSKIDWLDRLAFREIELINEKEKSSSNSMYLMIEFPRFYADEIDYSVVHFEEDGDIEVKEQPPSELVMVSDPEWNMDNLVEAKHHKLTHSLRHGLLAQELIPNASTKKNLTDIISYPPTQVLTHDEKTLIWSFRYYLTKDNKALPKFLQCVDWGSSQEVDEALSLMEKWQPMDSQGALELLTPRVTHPMVKKYAICQLQQADNEELLLYLLQLVQALRYDIEEEIGPQLSTQEDFHSGFFVEENFEQASRKTLIEQQLAEAAREEGDDEVVDDRLVEQDANSSSDEDEALLVNSAVGNYYTQMSIEASVMSLDTSASSTMATSLDDAEYSTLAKFLTARACRSTKLASYFYWYLSVECHEDKNPTMKERFTLIRRTFLSDLCHSDRPKWRKRYQMLRHQGNLIILLQQLVNTVSQLKEDRSKRIEHLNHLLATKDEYKKFTQPIRLPLDMSKKVVGISQEKAHIYKSALMPLRVSFRTTEETDFAVILKSGDDPRQDQLILQLILLMDRLLRRENLDLKLIPFKVLACSSTFGLHECIESTTVFHVLSKYRNIQTYLRQCAPAKDAPYGIRPDVMENYLKSCAGYCVITYLLSVGDRHFDNLLLTPNGNLFHIDFGYILGRDPKPFPPPMKLSKEMVEAMGGTASQEYTKFREYCYNAFLILRRSANLILNLFSLMLDANVPDIALEPDKTIQKVRDRFCLNLSEEQAVQNLQQLMEESISALFPQMVEQIHRWAQYWRK
ncbi:phosphatidylinositol 3-kinase catalytic subunit type 3-like [Dysidea avara]|uniref:phosphatidylinositol 3-kinase catalytic subunit type 3-like n=1 Tax=Dysidea avara TaxID=196820 RepID=UPI00332787D6